MFTPLQGSRGVIQYKATRMLGYKHEAREQPLGQIKFKKESATIGNPWSLFLLSFFSPNPFTRGVGVKNIDAVPLLNRATALGR